jgi:hypothetical protein
MPAKVVRMAAKLIRTAVNVFRMMKIVGLMHGFGKKMAVGLVRARQGLFTLSVYK